MGSSECRVRPAAIVYTPRKPLHVLVRSRYTYNSTQPYTGYPPGYRIQDLCNPTHHTSRFRHHRHLIRPCRCGRPTSHEDQEYHCSRSLVASYHFLNCNGCNRGPRSSTRPKGGRRNLHTGILLYPPRKCRVCSPASSDR